MSVAYPIPAQTREAIFTASAGQTVFGPLNFYLFAAPDIVVHRRSDDVWLLVDASDYMVTVAPPARDWPAYPIVTFNSGWPAGMLIRIRGWRLHARLTNVTQGGAIASAAIEREFDRQTVVLQELHRDVIDLRDVVDYPRFYLSVDAVGWPASGEVLARHIFADEVAFAANLAPSQGRAVTPPRAAAVISIRKNDVEFATATFGAGATVSVFVGAATLFAIGDVLTCHAPPVRDETLADLVFTLAGSRQ